MTNKKILRLHVVMDTNIIFHKELENFISPKVLTVIHESKRLSFLEVNWFIPDIVFEERSRQLIKQSAENLKALRISEKVLKKDFKISDDNFAKKILNNNKVNLTRSGIKIIYVDVDKINWKEAILLALNKSAPFKEEKDEGFKDLVIFECIKQYIKTLKKTDVFFVVCIDKRLCEALEFYFKGKENLELFKTISEAESRFKSLNVNIKKTVIDKIADSARKLFFTPGDDHSIYNTSNIRQEIYILLDQYGPKINPFTQIREEDYWDIKNPLFDAKDKNIFYWKTEIKVSYRVLQLQFDKPILNNSNSAVNMVGWLSGVNRNIVESGVSTFEVRWAIKVDSNNNLSSPVINLVVFKENEIL